MEATATLIDLNKDQLQGVIDSIKDKLKELGLEKLRFTLHKQLIFSDNVTKQGIFVFEGLVSPSLKEKVDQLNSELKKILGTYGEETFAVDVEVGLGEGERFPVLDDLNVVPSKESGKKFECAEGEVVLIDFWATWCGPCQRPMQHNQEMLEKNEEKWKGKARIVGVSLDDDIESVIKRVEERKWEKIEHYHAPGGFSAPAAAQFGINGIPCVFLVDKKGVIQFRGHPSSINLEDKINELITGAPAEAKKEEHGASKMVCNDEGCSIVHHPKPSEVSLETEAEVIKKFQEKHEANKNLIEKVKGFTTGVIGSREFKSDEKASFNGRLLVAGLIASQDKEAVTEYYKNVIQPLSGDFTVTNRVAIKDVPAVKRGTTCATCKKVIDNSAAHYICTFCQGEAKEDHAFCLECADKELTQDINSGKDLFHQHGLLLIDEGSDNSLASLKRVLNNTFIMPDDHPQIEQVRAAKGFGGVGCDVCGKRPIPGYRWACANCPDFDYCAECWKAARDPNHEKHKEVVDKSFPKGHDNSHIFYRSHYLMYLRPADPKPFQFPTNH